MRRIALLGLATLFLAGVTLGEDFWVKKDYTQWSGEEVKKIMTDSPWAKDVAASVPSNLLPRPAAAAVDPTAAPARRGRSAPADGDSAPADGLVSLTVSWRSALPLRKAIVKSRVGASSEIPEEMKQMLKDQDEYVIAVSGVPANLAPFVQDARTKLSALKIGKRAPLMPKSVDFQKKTQSIDVFFSFPKSEIIMLADKEVEFDVVLGPINAKRKFTLKDMVYNGKLEL
ncbi:MAG TPA: hypothetical protein VGK48_15550 [Terriglobia bacterium]|jgi:hypothetical protein